jgi:hypothetical protein
LKPCKAIQKKLDTEALIIQTLQIHVWHFPFCVALIKLTLKGITSQDTEALFPAIHEMFQMFAITVVG